MSSRAGKLIRLADRQSPAYRDLIPPGEYTLAFSRHLFVRRFDREVLELWFIVADLGECLGKEIPAYFTVQKTGKRGAFTARPGSEFVRSYANVFGERPQFDRGPLEAFNGCKVVGRIETVKRDHKQRQLPEPMRYSKISELLRKEVG